MFTAFIWLACICIVLRCANTPSWSNFLLPFLTPQNPLPDAAPWTPRRLFLLMVLEG
jgi:hypothetical protein